MRIAIPRKGEDVAPCFGYCSLMSIYTVEGDRVVDRMDFPLTTDEPTDRIRLLRDQNVAVIVCGGVRDVFEQMVRANGIEVISWASGAVDDLLGLYLRGQLVPETDAADTCKGRQK